jgi:hypothetical protein
MRPFALPLAISLVGAPQIASAFKCSDACSMPPCPQAPTQVWQIRCIPFAVNPNHFLFDEPDERLLVAQSFAVWSNNSCTDVTFKDEGTTDQLEHFDVNEAPSDQRNVVAAVDDASAFGDPDLLALTLTHFSVGTGEILDADIIINVAGFRFEEVSDPLSCRLQPRTFDLRNTLVHEIGHLIGFDHVNLDDATMFGNADACEIQKRDLAQDDIDGVCTVYPTGAEARACRPVADYTPSNAIDPLPYRNQCDRRVQVDQGGGGCSCTAGKQGGALGWTGLLVLGWLGWLSGRRTSRPLRRS